MSQTTDTLSGMLVRRAARTAPSSLSARLEEEWLADLRERASGPSRLAFAFGCFWASATIGREHRPLTAAVASAVHGNAATLIQPPGFLSSRAVTFGLVLCLHAAVFYGLMLAGMHTRLFKPADPAPLKPRMIDVPPPKIVPPAPRIDLRFTYEFRLPPIVDPPPLEPKRIPDPIVGELGPPEPPVLPDKGSLPREVIHVQGGAGLGFPHPDEYYPDAARRLEEQGTTSLQVCVDAAGRLTGEPISTQTSGSARLDTAAIRLAKAGSGHYRPSTDDGRPVNSCYPLRIRFQLKN
jgi:TonB family protein